MTMDERKDSRWLQQQAVELLALARQQSEIDIGSCTKLIDLLWKMLPKHVEESEDVIELERIRRDLISGRIYGSEPIDGEAQEEAP